MSVWDEWTKAIGVLPPLGYVLREYIPERWFRIHSLRFSKRHPEDSGEMRAVLHRYNLVASAVLGIGSPCTVFSSGDERNVNQARLEADPVPEWAINKDFLNDFAESHMTFLGDPIVWRPGVLDPRLCARAMDDTWPFAVFSRASRAVFIPYDGGADLFLPSPADVEPARRQFRNWLSAIPSGL